MEITKREIIVSVSILALMVILGLFISGKISEHIQDSNAKYNKALKIKDEDLFKYAMKTSAGYAFVEGELKAKIPVEHANTNGKYIYLEEVKERYTRHTRVETYSVNGKTRTRTKVYWSWDKIDSSKEVSDKIHFLGVDFKTSQFKLPTTNYIETIRESSRIRYKYYGIKDETQATIFTHLANNNIENKNVKVYSNKNTNEVLEEVNSGSSIYAFWVIWILCIVAIIAYFYYLENGWLNID